MKNEHLFLIGGLALIAGVGWFIYQKKIKYVPVSPAPDVIGQDPRKPRGNGQDCERLVQAGAGVAVATGNPYAMAGGAFAGIFNGQLCDGWRDHEGSGWGVFSPIPGGAATVNKWQNGNKLGAVADALNPLTPLKALKFW